ncbi:MAG TPA: sulfatase-like hydrolase/transferase [Chitinophagaceae bacterium]|nr:sulfatase-like hydrolase/transferase [Chitinophagaceae bacterium]
MNYGFAKKNTYSVFFHFILFFLVASFLVRTSLLFLSFASADIGLRSLLRIYATGFMYDLGVSLFFVLPYSIYLAIIPLKWHNSRFNRWITYTAFFLAVLISMFSFFAEFTFWGEFQSRFNFIAVDYLVYTYEVVKNINESYPLPVLISSMLAISLLIVFSFYKKGFFSNSFNGTVKFPARATIAFATLMVTALYSFFISNNLAEGGINRYQNELSKAGIYSFFSAFKNNELSYDEFYRNIDQKNALQTVRQDLQEPNAHFISDSLIRRDIKGDSTMIKPNVIMVTIESLSADFLEHFGNKDHITPVLDSLWNESITFTNLYATGNRTVRGMEALSLAIPPTPGSSIVRRPNNEHLTTIGSIFRANGYNTSFFYGGDGYFDNMNHYFGNNGYMIHDRGRNMMVSDDLEMPRVRIPDSLVHFENAWGISDEDLYNEVIRDADKEYSEGKLFYDFVMTTSNHRPYTYPDGRIDIPSGSGRNGAVKFTDWAIGDFLGKIKNKPWFKNTVVIFIADHCASSAGKNEIDVSKYHIPALIYDARSHTHITIDKLCSQIDLYPTLLSMLHWNYRSDLFGKNVLAGDYRPRTYVGTYQKLGYLENDSLVILSPQRKVETYLYNKDSNSQKPEAASEKFVQKAISNYQTAYYLFKHQGLKL